MAWGAVERVVGVLWPDEAPAPHCSGSFFPLSPSVSVLFFDAGKQTLSSQEPS